MKEITSLPCTAEQVEIYTVDDLASLIIELANSDNKIKGQAAMHVNAFLAHAAVKLARAIEDNVYILNTKEG